MSLWVVNMTKTPAQLWLMELERERFDTSWRNQKPPERYAPSQPIIVKQQIVAPAVDHKAQRERDQIMFHAGRFAAGSRDEEATAANAKVGKLIQKGNK